MMGQWLQAWRVDELLGKYPGPRLRPAAAGTLRIAGTLEFSAEARNRPRVSDRYVISLQVAPSFPRSIPVVREMEGRISESFHQMSGGELCLGSPTRIRLILAEAPSLCSFVERCVIPYLYGYSLVEQGEVPPFGELSHGAKGLREDLADLIGFEEEHILGGFVRLLSMKRRQANRRSCPCGSGLRLGRCHNRKVNALRSKLGRRWFAPIV